MQDELKNVTMENLISFSLRWGVIVSSVIIAIGFVMFLVSGQSGYPGDTYPTSISMVLTGVYEIRPFALIEFGLILLIATPVIRVVISILAAILEKDTMYIVINTFVLAVLILSLFLGKAGA